MTWYVRQTLLAVRPVAHRQLVSRFRLIADGEGRLSRRGVVLECRSGVGVAAAVRRFGRRCHTHLEFGRGGAVEGTVGGEARRVEVAGRSREIRSEMGRVVRCGIGHVLRGEVGVGGDDLVRIRGGGKGLRFELGIEAMGKVAEGFGSVVVGSLLHDAQVHLKENAGVEENKG